MKIGNIIYEKKLVNHQEVDYVNYIKEGIVYNPMEMTIPTLYVGWNFMKKYNLDNQLIQNADITIKYIINGELHWEFEFDENKASHVNGIKEFIEELPKLYFENRYFYINLDPVFFNIGDIEDLILALPKEIDRTYKYKDEMLYVLKDDKIWGINLLMYDYFKFDINAIVERVFSKSNLKYVDDEAEIFQKFYKKFPNYTYLKRYIVTVIDKIE